LTGWLPVRGEFAGGPGRTALPLRARASGPGRIAYAARHAPAK
jgi:hypothetical protein